MKNLIPKFSSQDELFYYLRANKSNLIAQKKALPTTSDDLEFGYSLSVPFASKGKTKAAIAAGETEDKELGVDIIANMSGWCDSQMDVMLKDSWKKSINDVSASGKKLVYHLKNHGYKMDDVVGKDPSLYTKDIDLSMFNIKSDIKTAQALMMRSTVAEKYDCKVYNLYADGQVKQHSIGLQYINLVLCLNSKNEEDAQEKKNWDKYYPQVINKEFVDGKNYFWAVIEAKINEVSAVLFGANILTPVYSTDQPSSDTGSEPSKSDTPKNEEEKKQNPFDLMKAIRETTFIY